VAESALAVEHLFTITATTSGATAVPGGPQGSRTFVAITGGTFAGPKLKGTVDAAGGDWLTVRADGSMRLDVRIVLKTADGVPILMSYNGIGVQKDGAYQLRSAPQFEAGDARYAWLNNVQAVGIGRPTEGGVTYDVYALR
jgi:hypothetical protein